MYIKTNQIININFENDENGICKLVELYGYDITYEYIRHCWFPHKSKLNNNFKKYCSSLENLSKDISQING